MVLRQPLVVEVEAETPYASHIDPLVAVGETWGLARRWGMVSLLPEDQVSLSSNLAAVP